MTSRPAASSVRPSEKWQPAKLEPWRAYPEFEPANVYWVVNSDSHATMASVSISRGGTLRCLCFNWKKARLLWDYLIRCAFVAEQR